MLYYSYPKSRKQFNFKFRNQLASLFSLILNGLRQAKSNTNHWNLDIGSGNLLENVDELIESESEFDRRLLASEYIKTIIDILTSRRPEDINPPDNNKLKNYLEENQMILFKDKEIVNLKYSPLMQR